MAVCNICGKKMPEKVLSAHQKKRHLDVAVENIKEDIVEQQEVTSLSEPEKVKVKWYDRWNAGEINTCQQCHREFPVEIMEFHMHVRHGL